MRQGFQSCQVEGVAFNRMGQSGYKGRYAFHFHLTRLSPGAYFRHNTVYDSNSRFVSIHGCHNASIVGNVLFKATGTGLYLEDGSEANNVITDNLSVWLRAGIRGPTNPRNTFAIFCDANDQGAVSPFRLLDCHSPAHFWIRNPSNYISRNKAVGSEGTGHGYWFFGGSMNRPSAEMRWDSTTYFAYTQQGMQAQLALVITDAGETLLNPAMGMPPRTGYPRLLEFVNNSAALVTFFVNTVPDVGTTILPSNANENATAVLPLIFNTLFRYSVEESPGGGVGEVPAGLANPLYCPPFSGATPSLSSNCSAPCGVGEGSQAQFCDAHVMVGFTGSFGVGTDVNFAAVWLRSHFFLALDFWVSDVIGGGVNLVSAGDYSGVPVGYWGACYGCVFHGQSQHGASPFSLPRGPVYRGGAPFGDSAAVCTAGLTTTVCFVREEAMYYAYGDFAYNVYLKIYDGPMSALNCAFIDIKAEPLGECDATAPAPGQTFRTPYCTLGVPLGADGACVLAATGLGWKSPNGFSYPPAYLLRGLSFENVDIRHFITVPQFLPASFEDDVQGTHARFCGNSRTLPTAWGDSFSAIDRQTSFREVDGSLTGLRPSTGGPAYVVNDDPFLRSPGDRLECRSLNSSLVSPFRFFNILLRNSGWLSVGSLKNQGPDRARLFQAWRLSYDPATESPASTNATAMFLQGPRGVGTTLAMEGTRYLLEIANLPPEASAALVGPEGGNANFNPNCTFWAPVVSACTPCCVPKPGLTVNCCTQPGSGGKSPFDGSFPFRSFDLSPPGKTFFVQFQFASSTQEPVELVTFVGSSLVLDQHSEWLYLVQYQKTDPPPATPFAAVPGPGFDNQVRTDPQFPVPGQTDAPGTSPPNKRQVSWKLLQDPAFYAGKPAPWNNQTTLLQLFAPRLENGFLAVTFDFRAVAAAFADGEAERCGPIGMCAWQGGACRCSRTDFAGPSERAACQDLCGSAGGLANDECPGGGCFGFAFSLPAAPYTPPDYASLTPAGWAALPAVAARAPWPAALAARSLAPAQAVCL